MPHVNADSLALPFSGITPLSRHCSHQGAVDAAERVGRQCLALLSAYRVMGPLTDAEAARELGVERTTVNARRSELVTRGLVHAIGSRKNEATGIRNTTWGLRP